VTDMRYEAPTTIAAAVALLAEQGPTARGFAGGTDLLIQMNETITTPSLLVDVKKIDALRSISLSADEIRIGAAVTGAELGEHQQLGALWPGVVEAVELIGSTQVQGRATLGGNLCNASPAADSVPALIAAGAIVEIAGPDGTRRLPAEQFLTGPGQTSLQPCEFVVAIILANPSPQSADAYLRFIPRTEMDIAVVGAGAAVTLNSDGTCTSARLALGAIAPTVRVVESVPGIMAGNPLDDQVLAALAEAASAVCDPINDKRGTIEFRTQVAGVLARRAMTIAWQRAEER